MTRGRYILSCTYHFDGAIQGHTKKNVDKLCLSAGPPVAIIGESSYSVTNKTHPTSGKKETLVKVVPNASGRLRQKAGTIVRQPKK